MVPIFIMDSGACSHEDNGQICDKKQQKWGQTKHQRTFVWTQVILYICEHYKYIVMYTTLLRWDGYTM